jgi:hypothetical protein
MIKKSTHPAIKVGVLLCNRGTWVGLYKRGQHQARLHNVGYPHRRCLRSNLTSPA